jgi:hypothetical protein
MYTKLLLGELEVANRLRDVFGVTKEEFTQVVYAGVGARNECTPHHPPGTAGTRCWSETIRALRDLLIPMGWRVENNENVPCVVSRERKIMLTVTNATSGTGIEWAFPQPLREKGDGTKRLVYQNQMPLFPLFDDGLNEQGTSSFWYLCIYCGEGDVVRAEVLCPILNDEGEFRVLLERIAIIGDDSSGGGPLRRETEDPTGDLDITVTRKAS